MASARVGTRAWGWRIELPDFIKTSNAFAATCLERSVDLEPTVFVSERCGVLAECLVLGTKPLSGATAALLVMKSRQRDVEPLLGALVCCEQIM